MKANRFKVKSILVAALLAAVAGCAGTGTYPSSPDDVLCAEARTQKRQGDPNWMATIDRIQDLQTAWYCVNYLIASDDGFIQGGP